jgi:hypothetical protein
MMTNMEPQEELDMQRFIPNENHIPSRKAITINTDIEKQFRARAKALGYRLHILHAGTAYHLIDMEHRLRNKTDDHLIRKLTEELDIASGQEVMS